MEIDYFTKNIHNCSIFIKGLCMKTALLLVVAIIWAANIAYSATPDSCLKMIWKHEPENLSLNPDSVKEDICPDSPTYRHRFAKKWYGIKFPKQFYPFDQILDTNEVKGVSDISTSHPALKNRFLELQDTLGLIYFQGLREKYPDSTVLKNPYVLMFFENYQDYRYITDYFNTTIDSVEVDYAFVAKQLTGGVMEEGSRNKVIIYPNPVKNYLTIYQNNSGIRNNIIAIYSVGGKRILETAYQEKLDVSMLLSGSYFLRINNQTIKFIKE